MDAGGGIAWIEGGARGVVGVVVAVVIVVSRVVHGNHVFVECLVESTVGPHLAFFGPTDEIALHRTLPLFPFFPLPVLSSFRVLHLDYLTTKLKLLEQHRLVL